MLKFENEMQSKGYKLIAGIDEAGRGPLAGAVFVAMAIMPLDTNNIIPGVDDSKKLSPAKRRVLFEKIKNTAIAYSICSVDEKAIDEINILEATKLGIKKCLQEISIKPDFCLVDYVAKLTLDVPFLTIVKGDALSYSIACASILAKVARDNYMDEMDKIYPNYKFAKHKGYGTKEHYECLDKFGISELHRKSFLKKYEASNGR